MEIKRIIKFKYIYNILIALVLAVGLFLPFTTPVHATISTLTVTGEGVYTVGTYNGAGNWNNMNSDDGAVSELAMLIGEGMYHTWTVSPMAGSPIINSITVYFKACDSGTSTKYAMARVGGADYLGVIGDIAPVYTLYSYTWTVNPSTGHAWTTAEINAAEFGVAKNSTDSSEYITWVYVEVDYTATVPVMTTSSISNIAATTATGNGIVVSNGGFVLTEKGIAICLASHGDPDTGDTTFHDHVDSVGAYTESLVGLVKGTDYHARAYAINAIGTGYGATVDFTTINDPTISTLAASVVSSTTARLNSQITFDGKMGGGEPCTVTFVYKSGSGYANYAAILAAGGTETAVAGTYTVTQAPYLDVAGLVIATEYSFAVKTINSTATTVYGTVITFTTESGVYTPTNFSAIPTATTISLAWTKGVGASNSWISYLTATYPAVHTDGVLAYSGTSNSYIVTGLSPGTTYYFSLWGYTGAVFSATYITIACTTSVTTENVTVVPPSEYATPTQWFQAPDYTRMSAFPLYDVINWGADQFQIPRGTSWFVIAIIFSMCIGILIYRLSTNIPAAAFSIAMVMYICSLAGIMEMWLMLPFILIGGGAWIQGNRA